MKQKPPEIIIKYRSIKVKIYNYFRNIYKAITKQILNRPEISFFSVIGILFILIIAGNFIRRPPEKTIQAQPNKSVRIYSIGASPKLRLSAKIEKSGAVKIVAQTSGIVQSITGVVGEHVGIGQTIIDMSTNYQGGVLPGVSRQIAEASNKFVNDNYDFQLDSINRRRNLAQTQYNQTQDLTDLTNQSIADTANLITFNEQLNSSIDNQLNYLNATNVNHSNDALILQVTQAKSGVESGLLSLQSSLRNAQYQVDPNHAPANLASLQKDTALSQLELEERTLNLNREVSGLNLEIAQISEAMMYPASPVNGVIERIYVTPGQNVTPGTVLASITANANHVTAIVSVSKELAEKISKIESAKIEVNGKSYDLKPTYVSVEPTEGSLNSVTYQIPDEIATTLVNNSNLAIDIPIGAASSTGSVPFVPLDAIYQTQNQSYIYVASESAQNKYQAKSQPVKIGQIFGQFVEVTDGLKTGDQVILDRNVIDSDLVDIIK